MKKFIKRDWKERGQIKKANKKNNYYIRRIYDEVLRLQKENENLQKEKNDYKELYEILSQKYKKINLENKKHKFYSKFIRNYLIIATVIIVVLSFVEGYLIINS